MDAETKKKEEKSEYDKFQTWIIMVVIVILFLFFAIWCFTTASNISKDSTITKETKKFITGSGIIYIVGFGITLIIIFLIYREILTNSGSVNLAIGLLLFIFFIGTVSTTAGYIQIKKLEILEFKNQTEKLRMIIIFSWSLFGLIILFFIGSLIFKPSTPEQKAKKEAEQKAKKEADEKVKKEADEKLAAENKVKQDAEKAKSERDKAVKQDTANKNKADKDAAAATAAANKERDAKAATAAATAAAADKIKAAKATYDASIIVANNDIADKRGDVYSSYINNNARTKPTNTCPTWNRASNECAAYIQDICKNADAATPKNSCDLLSTAEQKYARLQQTAPK